MIAKTVPVAVATSYSRVLFVDLDDTLVQTDLLAESFAKAARECPLKLLAAIPSITKGRAALKGAMANIVTPNAALLPYRRDVIEFLHEQQEAGVKLVLATASPEKWAREVADYLGLFDDVIASSDERNLKGRHKLEAIREYVAREQFESWGYLGDSSADLAIFAEADHAYLVTHSKQMERRALQAAPGRLAVMKQAKSSLRDVVKAMRPHQWVKNVLVFVPMILGHAFAVPQIISAFLAWACFSSVASGVYILNDILDVEADRRHPTKCRRPFASARLSIASGIPLFLGLVTTGITLAVATLPAQFVLLLLGYFALTTAYSLYLKNKLILDVMILAGLYTLRVIAGGAAVNVPVSEWLMGFSIFLFTSLAFAKRYAELRRMLSESHSSGEVSADAAQIDDAVDLSAKRIHGRSYRIEDMSLIESLGPTSGYLSVLVLALYINSPQVTSLYRNVTMLWYVCPLVMYWITRLWFVAKRGKLSEDPIVFALKDKVSLITGALVCLVMLVAVVF